MSAEFEHTTPALASSKAAWPLISTGTSTALTRNDTALILNFRKSWGEIRHFLSARRLVNEDNLLKLYDTLLRMLLN
jgi:hypothetical protein